jgi:capsular polysaccharide biosynthesis protein cap5D
LDYEQWIQNYEAHRSYERHGFTRVVDPRQGRLLEEHRN